MAGTLSLSSVNSFTDSGQEFVLDCVVGFAGTYTTGGDDASTLFKDDTVKVRSYPKSGFGITPTGYSLYLDTTNKKISLWNGSTEFSSGGSLTGVTAAARFYFKKV